MFYKDVCLQLWEFVTHGPAYLTSHPEMTYPSTHVNLHPQQLFTTVASVYDKVVNNAQHPVAENVAEV